MRIEQLKLTRYGAFTDHLIDFGPADKAGDFHIIYGPNEAGKSTLRQAVMDILYGFPQRTPYNFLHANDALLLSARLNVDGENYTFQRIKRNKSSLSNEGNQLVSEDVISGLLGGVNRESYANMFSLDEDSLEEGGESILRSEGDLGELLFSAASGLSGLSRRLAHIRTDSDTFYKKRSRMLRLNGLKKELLGLQNKIREQDVPASQYAALLHDESVHRQSYESALAEQKETIVHVAKLKTWLDCADPWQEYQLAKEEFKGVKNMPDLPLDALAEASELAIKSAEAKAGIKADNDAVKRETMALNEINVDQKILALSGKIDRLSKDDNEAKFRVSRDISSRQDALSALQSEIEFERNKLGAPEGSSIQNLLLPSVMTAGIKELAALAEGVQSNVRTADTEVRQLSDKVESRKAKLAKFDDAVNLSTLAEMLAAVREDMDDRVYLQWCQQTEQLHNGFQNAWAELVPWNGDIERLLKLSRPTGAMIQALAREDAEITKLMDALSEAASRLQDDHARLNSEIEAQTMGAGLIDEAKAIHIRANRESAWKDHRQKIRDGEDATQADLELTADLFESAIVEDDRITQSRLLQTTDIAALRKRQIDLSVNEAEIDRNTVKREALEARQSSLKQQVVELSKQLKLANDTQITTIDVWLTQRDIVIEAYRRLEDAQREQTQRKHKIGEADHALTAAMVAAKLDTDGLNRKQKLERCEHAIIDWRERKTEKKAALEALDDAEKELATRTNHQAETHDILAKWEQQWVQMLGGGWIGSRYPEASAAQVLEILEVLHTLEIKLDKQTQLSTLISAMKADRDAYVKGVEQIAKDADEPFDSEAPLNTADLLRNRCAKARENQRLYQAKEDELREFKQQLNTSKAAIEHIDLRFVALAEIFSGKDFTTLIAKMRLSETKMRLQQQINKIFQQLSTNLSLNGQDEIETLLTEKLSSPEARIDLQSEHASLSKKSDDMGQYVSSLYHDWKQAENALGVVGDDATVAQLEEKIRVLLLQIESEAKRFLALSTGTMLVDSALNQYLDTHRSSMLDQASKAFSTITRGAFSGLAAMPGKSSEVLVGIRQDGSSIIAPDMSRGTRFQLYLGLRIAGYLEFVKHRKALPFFADDILETFDDDRSAETFSLMGEMAQKGQIIYLTHHRHLCEIAKSICGEGVKIHELLDRAIRD